MTEIGLKSRDSIDLEGMARAIREFRASVKPFPVLVWIVKMPRDIVIETLIGA